MKTGRWDRIRELFETACELDTVHRRTFLADACGDDEHLRAEIESILAASDEPALLDEPAVSAFPELFEPHQAQTLVGRRVGAYKLLRLLACGGMGANRAKGCRPGPTRSLSTRTVWLDVELSRTYHGGPDRDREGYRA